MQQKLPKLFSARYALEINLVLQLFCYIFIEDKHDNTFIGQKISLSEKNNFYGCWRINMHLCVVFSLNLLLKNNVANRDAKI